MKPKKMNPQVTRSHYIFRYDTKSRWVSYWHQIDEVVKSGAKSVLEVGLGNGTVSSYMRRIGLKVTTVDFDSRLNPDIVSDVRKLRVKRNVYDIVLCCQVLEHIPFEDVRSVLKKFYKMAAKRVIISLPDANPDLSFYFGIKFIPFIPKWSRWFKIRYPHKHLFEKHGQHHWEIGKRGYPLSRILTMIRQEGFVVYKTYLPEENQYHRFFILDKKL